MKNAKETSKILADAAFLKLKEIVLINNSFDEVRVRSGMAYDMDICAQSSSQKMSSLSSLTPEDIKFTANVTVEWSIE